MGPLAPVALKFTEVEIGDVTMRLVSKVTGLACKNGVTLWFLNPVAGTGDVKTVRVWDPFAKLPIAKVTDVKKEANDRQSIV